MREPGGGRPARPLRRPTGHGVPRRTPETDLVVLQRQLGNQGVGALLRENAGRRSSNPSPATVGRQHDLVVQRAVSPSAMWAPNAAATALITTLDGLIAGAEQAASQQVQNLVPVAVHTPTQAAYMYNPTPALWGSCVEEQLNTLALAGGWTTQWPLRGAVPDYGRLLPGGGIVFADLTSAQQAGPGGNHITVKLNTARANDLRQNPFAPAPNWYAADITHGGQNPLGQPGAAQQMPNFNGRVTVVQLRRMQLYNAWCADDNAEWTLEMARLRDWVRGTYRGIAGNGAIHLPAFTQTWNARDRQLFVAAAHAAGLR